MQRRTVQWCLASLLLLIAPGAWAEERHHPRAADDFRSDVASAWFDLLYDVVKTEQSSAPVAARIYGIAAVALYESIVLGSRAHKPLAGQLNGWPLEMGSPLATVVSALLPPAVPGLPDMVKAREPPGTAEGQAFLSRLLDWPSVANSVLARVVRGFFPSPSLSSLAAITAVEQAFAAESRARVPRHVYTLSVVWGQMVAEAVLAWAATDGMAALDNCPYTPPVGPGLWQPTPPAFTPTPLQPCWGQLRPFVLTSGDECAPPPHPPYSAHSTSAFHMNAWAVYQTNRQLTPEQKTIASYWADNAGATGTPAGHWIAIMGQLARQGELSLIGAAEGFARVGIAAADAFISCWETKYTYNLLRPVTYIRDLMDPDWLPFIGTPSFPEYTSGHSAQSGAVSTVLTDLFGVRAFTDTTHTDHSVVPSQEPRTFSSFDEAAEEAARSRLYGGIHYPFGNNNGLAQGRCIGQIVLDRIQFMK